MTAPYRKPKPKLFPTPTRPITDRWEPFTLKGMPWFAKLICIAWIFAWVVNTLISTWDIISLLLIVGIFIICHLCGWHIAKKLSALPKYQYKQTALGSLWEMLSIPYVGYLTGFIFAFIAVGFYWGYEKWGVR